MQKFQKTWESISSRPVPEWYDRAKLGIFVHWGLYSVPAYAPKRNEVNGTGDAYAEWYEYRLKEKNAAFCDFHKEMFGEKLTYSEFPSLWRAELFDAEKWAKLFKYAGAKYVHIVSKHHDGYTLWKSAYSGRFNSVDSGPRRDLLGELLNAVEKEGIRRGVYYSLWEWNEKDLGRYVEQKMLPQMKELIEKYHPYTLFTDGEWMHPSNEWRSLEFLEWLFNESSVRDEIVINDRWGSDTRGVYGGYFTTEYGEINSAAISEKNALAQLVYRKWEENRSIGASFGFNRNEGVADYLSPYQLIDLLIDTICKGGNLCLNVGPCADGTIAAIIEERLHQLGDFMQVNGEAVYDTKPLYEIKGLPAYASAVRKKEEDGETIYIFLKKYPEEELKLCYAGFKNGADAQVLGVKKQAEIKCCEGEAVIRLPNISVNEISESRRYVLKISLKK